MRAPCRGGARNVHLVRLCVCLSVCP